MKCRPRFAPASLAAFLGLAYAAAAHAQPAQPLPQGWSAADSHYFYRTSQGSRMIPYAMFVTLETATGTTRFASFQNLSSYGYLFEANPPAGSNDNPDALPIGFVKDTEAGQPDYVGLTCSACHTRDITHSGTRLRIDGAPGYGDTERILADLEAAIGATVSDQAKFDRYRIANGVATGAPAVALLSDLYAAYDSLVLENQRNMPSDGVNNPGWGRLDALAHIKNRVSDELLPGNSASPQNNIDATAPVNFPFLWDAPYLDYVQWPGTISNFGIGSLARNLGEVFGVFAQTTVTSGTFGGLQVTTSANIPNLVSLEDHVLALTAPPWPAQFPPPDMLLAAIGKPIFAQYCGSCHVDAPPGPRTTYFQTFSVGASKVGTDATQADNNVHDQALAGLLSPSNPTGLVNPLTDSLNTLVADALIPDLGMAPALNASHKEPLLPPKRNVDLGSADPTPAHTYKARPLNGIWATPPYLHNGSVRTLAQLLLPGPERETSFCTGSIEFDATDVGLVSDCSVPHAYVYDTTKRGNGNLGHEYGTLADTRFPPLTDFARAAVLEYLKTL